MFIHKIFDIYSVGIETAGSAKSEATINAISGQVARELQTRLLEIAGEADPIRRGESELEVDRSNFRRNDANPGSASGRCRHPDHRVAPAEVLDDVLDLVRDLDLGWVCEPGDYPALNNAIEVISKLPREQIEVKKSQVLATAKLRFNVSAQLEALVNKRTFQ